MTIFDSEMQKALEADGELLRQMTGEDHGPYFFGENTPEDIVAQSDAINEFDKAVARFVSSVSESGGYMPAIATILRIKADELADEYPDEVNGGGVPSQA